MQSSSACPKDQNPSGILWQRSKRPKLHLEVLPPIRIQGPSMKELKGVWTIFYSWGRLRRKLIKLHTTTIWRCSGSGLRRLRELMTRCDPIAMMQCVSLRPDLLHSNPLSTPQCDAILTEPSHHANTSLPHSPPAWTYLNITTLMWWLMKKDVFLKKNKGCCRSHKPFTSHFPSDKICDFPSSINYVPVTQSPITSLKRSYQTKKHVASVTTPHSKPSPTITQENPVHLVTVLVPGVPNPIVYHSANSMNVIEDVDISDTSMVSAPVAPHILPVVRAFIKNINSPVGLDHHWRSQVIMSAVLPLFLTQHLFWRASISLWGLLPISFDCLIDNGSHLVLI